jgi:hypothetical protein
MTLEESRLCDSAVYVSCSNKQMAQPAARSGVYVNVSQKSEGPLLYYSTLIQVKLQVQLHA